MSLKFGPLHRRGFLKALGSIGLAASAWSLRLLPELGTARSSLAQAAGPSMDGHPLSKFRSIRQFEPAGHEIESAHRAILGNDDVRHVAKASGVDLGKLGEGKVGYQVDAEGNTLTIGAWIIDDKHVLIYASVDRRLEWFKSMSMVVTTDTEIGQVKAYTLNGTIPTPVKRQGAPATSAVATVGSDLTVTDAEAGYYGFCCGGYYSCCYDRWGNWQRYWHWTGMSPCGVNWNCAADKCGVPCGATCAAVWWTGVGTAACVFCLLIACGWAVTQCTYWCQTCFYCYET
jgi:hypothetical protein